jgi:thiol-disulfide isomerase/thioredoxin
MLVAMNKRVLVVLVVIGALIVGAVGVLALTRGMDDGPAAMPSSPAQNETDPDDDAPDPDPDDGGASTVGGYVDYSENAIAQAEGRILLFFHASWCPQCRALEEDILAEGVPDGVTIVKVDYDDYQNLRAEYGVTQQTTFVEVDSGGEALQSYVAYDDPRLAVVIDAML